MSDSAGEEPILTEFLLGGLTTEERERVEEQLFADDALHERLEDAADDLIDAYLAGALSPRDRGRFEAHFLAPSRRRQRLEFARQLATAAQRVAARQASARPRWIYPALAAVAMGGILVGVLSNRDGSDREPTRIPREAYASSGTTSERAAAVEPSRARPAPSQNPRAPGTPRPVPVVRPSRGERASTRLDLRGDPPEVRFEMQVDEGPPSFAAAVRREDGVTVWSADEIPPPETGQPLVVTVPASAFSGPGERFALRIEPEALRAAGPSPTSVEYALRTVRR